MIMHETKDGRLFGRGFPWQIQIDLQYYARQKEDDTKPYPCQHAKAIKEHDIMGTLYSLPRAVCVQNSGDADATVICLDCILCAAATIPMVRT